MHQRERVFVGGEWVEPTGHDVITVVDAGTEEPLAAVPACAPDDVDRAVAAASDAFDGWAATPVAERAARLERLHDALISRLADVATVVAHEVGTPLASSMVIQAGVPAVVARSFADVARQFRWEEEAGSSTVVYDAVGVVAAMTPWNFPLLMAVSKVAPALAAGCTIVLKPSEVAPLSAFALAESVEEAGFPPGVFNLLTGGPAAGQALVAHPRVDMVSFTGATATGKRIAEAAAATLKRVTLELGGKSASLVLDDADLEEAVGASVRQAFLNCGQACMAWSRLLVPEALHDEAARLAAKVADGLVVGDPLDDLTDVGPLATAAQRDRVCGYIRRGVEEGAVLVAGGPERPDGLDRGYYARPTVFAGVTEGMVVATDEIFGPVLAVMAYKDDDDAVRIANASPYGLHGAVFSGDRERAERVARRLRTGQVDVNGVGGFNVFAPFGGYRQSGRGREFGRWGLEEYLEVKSLALP